MSSIEKRELVELDDVEDVDDLDHDTRERLAAWRHFKRTGVIIPDFAGEIAARLAERNGNADG